MRTRRILVIVWPEASAYNATFRLARVLRQRGHEVVYAVPSRWASYVTRQGFPTVALEVSEGPVSVGGKRHGLWAARALAGEELRVLQESLVRLGCRTFGLVLLYSTVWHFALVFRRLGIAYVLVNAGLGSPWNPDVPPLFSGLFPLEGRRLLNSVWCAGAWFMLRYLGAFSHRYRGLIQPRSSGALCRIRDAAIAARHLFRTVLEPFSMPVYHRVLRIARHEGIVVRWGDYGYRLVGTELVLGPAVIDFPRHRHRHARVYVGACVDPERVEDVFDWDRVKPNKPLVYCAIGSHGGHWNAANRLRLLESVVQSFRVHPEYQVLLQTVREDECRRLEPLPDNVLVAPWYPQLQVLARASLLITHGGFGTVREALFFGVPMIVFPCGVDQPGNAARLARLQACLWGDIRTVTPATISSMLSAIDLPPYRQNALRLGSTLRADNSCGQAVRVIEGLLQKTVGNTV